MAVRIHAYAYTRLMHAYAGMDLRMQLGFQKTMKDKFSALKLRIKMNLTSPGNHSKPQFFNNIKPYMVYFKNIQKILRENIKFNRNSE